MKYHTLLSILLILYPLTNAECNVDNCYLVERFCDGNAELVSATYGTLNDILYHPAGAELFCDGQYPVINDGVNIILDNDCESDISTFYCAESYSFINEESCMRKTFEECNSSNLENFNIAINAKIGECINIDTLNIHAKIFSDGNDIIAKYFSDDECQIALLPNHITKNGTCYDSITSYECNTKAKLTDYYYSFNYDGEENLKFIDIRKGGEDPPCIGGSRLYCYDNQLFKKFEHIDLLCTNVFLIDTDFNPCDEFSCKKCLNHHPIIDGSLLVNIYTSLDDCENNNDNKATMYISTGIVDEICNYRHYASFYNATHYKYTSYSRTTCIFQESGEGEYGKCVNLQSDQYIKVFINFFPNKPNEIVCDDICSVDKSISIIDTIYVYVILSLNNSNINIPIIDHPNPLFKVEGNGKVNLDQAILVIDIASKDDYSDFINSIKNNELYELIIVDGDYEGDIEAVLFQFSSDKITNCEKIVTEKKRGDNQLSIIFTVDSSNCGIKWWVIFIICIGCLILIGIVAVILILKVKRIRYYILPYR